MRFAVPLFFFFLGCSDGRSQEAPSRPCDDSPAEAKEQCLTDFYLGGYEPVTTPACSGFRPTDANVGGRKEIAFFHGPNISDEDVTTEGQYLQRFYESYDLRFFTLSASMPTSLVYALHATNAEINDAPSRAGIDPAKSELTEEEQAKLNRAVGDILFGRLRDFIQYESNPPKSRVNIIVLERVASPDVADLFEGAVIGGIGLSPTLFENIAESDPQKNLFDLIGLPAEFTPTLVVGHRDIVNLAKNPEGIVAHELGHSLGLQHTTEDGNLMTQGQATVECTPGLTAAQIDQLKASADQLAPRETWDHLFALRDRIVRTLRR